jgi:ABC-type uncharacterized transport system substrate-binding protein
LYADGNVTGVTNIGAELAGKRLEILKEIVPAVSRVAVLINPDDQNALVQMQDARVASDKLGVQLEPVHIREGADLKGAFTSCPWRTSSPVLQNLIFGTHSSTRKSAQMRNATAASNHGDRDSHRLPSRTRRNSHAQAYRDSS